MKTQKATLKGGYGYWRTDRYPIGGEFHRLAASIPVELTGHKINFGRWNGHVEFQVADGVQGTKGWTGYTSIDCLEVLS
jgi:hypothetical protein